MARSAFVTFPYVVGPGEGLHAPLGSLASIHKAPSYVTDGQIAVVEHTLPGHQLAAPLHRHSREDELTIVLDGRLGVLLGDHVVDAEPGSYVYKPRGQWHTLWNAGDEPLRFIELLIPGGVDEYFQQISSMLQAASAPDPAVVRRMAAEYGIEFDFESVPSLCNRFGVTFG
jgi:mannose-6-phosphate isomerase-like protein (cupin superfamily)